ncbi:MAG TPA: 4-(cytidine 5'-diphospho)-2-C-methyl-D-erythritol kinase [Ignavibacteria bacterium]|nr:4-(cytidine 5'-diphospho)-2-C-methyl-D-erythritol kinase [Ignavibacteria bacterium]
MDFVELKSPSKINVGLKIINKRPDGFHNLETIFYPVNLFDVIKIGIEKTEHPYNSVIINPDKPFVPHDKKNFCYKVVEAFFVEYKITSHYIIQINIEKNIPVGGGLGGGSSNAGTVLRYLIDYFKVDLNKDYDKIINIALSAGSDVPFFVLNKPCYAEGRGERIRVIENFYLDYDIILISPDIHISTKWAFETLGYGVNELHDSIISKIDKFYPDYPEYFENDFESIIFRRYPEIKKIKDELISYGAVFASMSGTGATVYGLFNRNRNIQIGEFDSFYKKGYKIFKT